MQNTRPGFFPIEQATHVIMKKYALLYEPINHNPCKKSKNDTKFEHSERNGSFLKEDENKN